MPGRLTKNIFVERSNSRHDNKYDYSLVDYKNNRKKVIIICKDHGEFLQSPDHHLNGIGCPKCGGTGKLDTSKFIERSKIKHGENYDYSKSEYVDIKTPIVIICKDHGEFVQSPKHHMNGHGCNKCYGNNKKTTSEFIKNAKLVHENKYDYSLVEYLGNNSPVKIICKEHGIFNQKPLSHLRGSNCKFCVNNNILKTKDQFVTDSVSLQENEYDYSLVEYKNNKIPVRIVCEKHGIFEQRPDVHLRGYGCPKCSSNISLMEKKWLDGIGIENEYRQYRIGKYLVDGIDMYTNTIYEFNGDFWHGNPSKYNSLDINPITNKTYGYLYKSTIEKEKYLIKLGYKVVSIWESDYLEV